jgi:hypothetical protein
VVAPSSPRASRSCSFLLVTCGGAQHRRVPDASRRRRAGGGRRWPANQRCPARSSPRIMCVYKMAERRSPRRTAGPRRRRADADGGSAVRGVHARSACSCGTWSAPGPGEHGLHVRAALCAARGARVLLSALGLLSTGRITDRWIWIRARCPSLTPSLLGSEDYPAPPKI